MRRTALIASIVCALIAMTAFSPTARADNPIFDVFAPTAYTGDCSGEAYGETAARELDSDPLCLPGPGYVVTADFTSTEYTEYWPPYDNRTNFPTSNATIYSVSLLTVVYAPPSRSFRLMLGIWNGSNYTGAAMSDWYQGEGGGYRAYEYNVTTEASWNGTNLKDSEYFSVWFLTLDSGSPIYVDYVGFNYTWQWNDSYAPPGGSSASELSYISISGMFGLAGFIGMIAAPAAGVWFWRRDGGSKLIASISVIGVFMVCFTLFLGSIG